MEHTKQRYFTHAKNLMGTRYGLFDLIRGILLVAMILYHSLWNLVYFYGYSIPWFQGFPGTVYQVLGSCLFIALSGFCWSFGKRALRRGITVFLAGAAVSLVTLIFMPEQVVYFGILTCIGSCMLLTIPLHALFSKKYSLPAFLLSLLLALSLRPLPQGYLGLGTLHFWDLPTMFYHGPVAAFLGFTPRSFSSSDYFPLLPNFFVFLAGYFFINLPSPASPGPKQRAVSVLLFAF